MMMSKRKFQIGFVIAVASAVVAGCTSPQDVVDSAKTEIVNVDADGKTFECLIIVENGGGQAGLMGMDCQWPGER